MTDSTRLDRVADSIDRLGYGAVNDFEITTDFAATLLSKYPTVQSAVATYIAGEINDAEFDEVVNTAVHLEGT